MNCYELPLGQKVEDSMDIQKLLTQCDELLAKYTQLTKSVDELSAGIAEVKAQIETIEQKAKPPSLPERQVWQDLGRMVYETCPCGCGLKGDVCEAQLKRVEAQNAAMPF